MKTQLIHSLLFSFSLGTSVFAGECSKESVPLTSPLEDGWRFTISVPGWVPGLYGELGINGLLADVNVPPDKVVSSTDMVAALRTEVSKGRLGLMGDFLYLSLSDGMEPTTIVQKVDLQMDITIGELAGRWRLIDHARGSLDLYAGIRYVNLYQRLSIQPDAQVIQESSTALVNAVSDRLRTALSDSGLRDLIQQHIGVGLAALEGRKPSIPQGPLGGHLPGTIGDRIHQAIEERKAELADAIQARVQAAGEAARVEAQNRVDDVKSNISRKIAQTLESSLDTTESRRDDWWDPFIGLRGRINLSRAWYLIAKADVGGFGVGSDFAWQAEGALGCQVSRNFFVELGYRALSMDYEDNGLIFDAVARGGQLTFGFTF